MSHENEDGELHRIEKRVRALEVEAEADTLLLLEILRETRQTLHLVKQLVPKAEQPATTFEVIQISGGNMPFPGPVVGTPLGGTSTFGLAPVGADGNPGALQPGNVPTYTVDDPKVALASSSDGSSVQATVDPSDTGTSYNVTVSGINSAGAPISFTWNVPILAVVPPPEQPATTFAVEQLS